MSEKYKLGLTRNRLFAFDNCVLFCGQLQSTASPEVLSVAMEKLSVAVPLVTAAVIIEDDGTAYAVCGNVETVVEKSDCTKEELFDRYEKNGLDFSERLFEFRISSDGYLVIAGHTAVADAKALLHIARLVALFCSKKYAYVEPGEVCLLPEQSKLPLEVVSPIIDRVSVDLEAKWNYTKKAGTVDNYRKARESYMKDKAPQGELVASLDEGLTQQLTAFSEKEGLDVSSVVAYAFYVNLLSVSDGKAKNNKMNLYTDRRFFFEDYENYYVGANNGTVTVSLKKRDLSKPVIQQLKKFHTECYKAATSVFRSFYDDFLLMKLSPEYCDSAYLYAAGVLKNRAAKKLAENYGCCNQRLFDYFSCNLDQSFWEDLSFYNKLTVKEPLKMRAAFYVGCTVKSGEAELVFRYNKARCNDEKAREILRKTIKEVQNIIS